MSGIVLVFLLSACTAFALTPCVRRSAHRLGALDHPAERKVHATSIPRIGGVSIAVSWVGVLSLAAMAGDDTTRRWLADAPLIPILGAATLVFVIGAWDDLRPLTPAAKLLVEVAAAAIVAGAGITIERVTVFGTTMHLGWLSTAATVLWIVGITNAFNLLDGLDGLATGLALIAGATCTIIVLLRGDYPTALILVALVGALLGFLPYNFNPASIFLGDCGSLLAGFVLAVTAITGWQKGATALAVGVPILVFALPIVDTTSAVARRLLRANAERPQSRLVGLARVLRPDRQHIHHHLVAHGLSARTAVLVLYLLALCLSAVALLTIRQT